MPVETRSGGRYVAGLSQAIALLPIVLRAGFGSLQSKYWFDRLPNSVSEQSDQPTIHCRVASKRSTRESIQIERDRSTSATTGSGSVSLGRYTHRLESTYASMTVQCNDDQFEGGEKAIKQSRAVRSNGCRQNRLHRRTKRLSNIVVPAFEPKIEAFHDRF